ncbi:MAG: GNAT family N-acetyltransferase [Bacteroidetes bacterium]|nr:GNAT family N-acetyltransferase [Bacteroidota bacterium]
MANLSISLVKDSDAVPILEIYQPIVERTAISMEYKEPSLRSLKKRVVEALDLWPWLVFRVNEALAGYAYAGVHRQRPGYMWCTELSVYVDSDHHKKGIATALYTSLIAILNIQGYRNAYAGITLPNPTSVSFHQSMGFKHIGTYQKVGYKHGKWHDVGWWALTIQDHPVDPELPLPISKLKDTQIFNEAINAGLHLVKL